MRLIYLSESQNNREKQQQQIYQVNQHVNKDKPLVIYFYREGCPHCIKTSSEWKNMRQHIEKPNDDLLAVESNGELYNMFQNVGDQPRLYPAIRFVHKNSVIPFTKEGDQRTAYSLAKWIEDLTQPETQSLQLSPDEMVEEDTDFMYSSPKSTSISSSSLIPKYITETEYSTNKYPPYSNQFIARNFNPTAEKGTLNNNLLKISQKRSRNQKRSRPISRSQKQSSSRRSNKSRKRSNRKSQTKSKSKKIRSYHTRFRSVKSPKRSQGKTAFI